MKLLKQLEKRQKVIVELFNEKVEEIKIDPKKSEKLKGDLKGYYKYEFTYRGKDIRIIYLLDESDRHIYFLYYGTRENFYNEVKRYLF